MLRISGLQREKAIINGGGTEKLDTVLGYERADHTALSDVSVHGGIKRCCRNTGVVEDKISGRVADGRGGQSRMLSMRSPVISWCAG